MRLCAASGHLSSIAIKQIPQTHHSELERDRVSLTCRHCRHSQQLVRLTQTGMVKGGKRDCTGQCSSVYISNIDLSLLDKTDPPN